MMFSSQQKMIFFALLFVLLGLLFALSVELYRTKQFDFDIQARQKNIEHKHERVLSLEQTFRLYTSEWYQERYAKTHMNKVYPGEKVIVIPQESLQDSLYNADRYSENILQTLTPLEVWRLYFFGRDVLYRRSL